MTSAEFADELVALLERCDLSEPLQTRTLVECSIAIMDRCKIAQGLPFTTRQEIEGFVRMVFINLRTKTGNASPPAGGIQA